MSDFVEVQKYSNHLASEKSPYLLQHAHNPVDWYPWGQAAFEKSKKEDKPILLSVGYSTCHWCHVMERESFEDPETARLMNQYFVSVKVDREERTDIDSVYMSYVMATTGGGGWPMTVFLTPDGKPFYGGTYFPPDDRMGMTGFKTLLRGIADAWKDRREEILKSADSAVSYLGAKRVGSPSEKKLSEETLYTAFERYKSSFDRQWGGFGGAPKFPRSHSLSMLLRYGRRSANPEALKMVEKTLQAMAQGGVYDQLGGGFHRYSTDGQWRVPHFEKMLYDQALLAITYLEAYQATRKEFYAQISREILDYVLKEMTNPDGGFYSAQDADSLDPSNPEIKREGAYFVWKKAEIEKILGPEDSKIFCFYYGIEDSGNALSDPHHEFTDQNVLYQAHSIDDQAEQLLMGSRAKLLNVRNGRPAPSRDDKILTDWNGLMLSAFSTASQVLGEPRYQKAAQRAALFIDSKLKKENGELWHRYREGESAVPGNLNDYAFLIQGYLHLYEATFDEHWLKESIALSDKMISLFWDNERAGFFLTASNAEVLIARPKELYDGAIPSGNSVAVLDLILLGRFTGESHYQELADKALSFFSAEISEEPTSYPQMLMALDFALGPSYEMVIAGSPGSAEQAMLKEIHLRFIPNKIMMLHKPGSEGRALEQIAPFVKDQGMMNGQTTAYVCRNHVCALPVTELVQLIKLLEEKGRK